MSGTYILTSILIIGAVTFLLRALPFTIGRWLESNAFIAHIKAGFPMIMMFILTCYAANLPKAQSALEITPQIVALGVTSIVHWYVKNFFLSIFVGVAVYIALIQLHFF